MSTTRKILFCYILFIPITISHCDCQFATERETNHYFIFERTGFKCTNVTLDGRHPLKSFIQHNEEINNFKFIDISNSNIPVLEKNIFDRFHLVENITLDNDGIIDIEKFTFFELRNLSTLSITYNGFTKFEENIFVELKKLILHHNKLTTLENINAPKLQILDISNNNIEFLDDSFFFDLIELTYLDMSSNNQPSLGLAPLTEIPALEELHIANNSILHFYIEKFKKPLKKLNLSNNLLELIFIDTNEKFVINHLDLSSNIIETIEDRQFANIEKLYVLNISENYINDISLDAFEDLNDLTVLDISANEINSLKIGVFHHLVSLQTLNLSYNNIETLDVGLFTGLRNLNILDFSENKIQALDMHTFYSLKNLEELYMHGNSLDYITSSQLIDVLKNLKHVSIHFKNTGCINLAQIIKQLHSNSVKVKQGHHVKVHNIHGIPCDPDIKDVQWETSYDSYDKQIRNILDNFPLVKNILISLIVVFVLFVIVKVLMMFNINLNYCRKFYTKNTNDNTLRNLEENP